ncbi:MAG: flagellar biosynthesis protein FlhF [Schwartzia sp.]|nr:flagellar biosynthesis protein FlhF [Schwartzia sp. (in: firmicutes)]
MPINDTPMGQRQIAERETGRTRQSAQRPQQPDQQRYMESAPRQGTRQAPGKNSNKTSYIAELQADIQIPQRPRRKAVRRVHNERPVPEDERTRKQIGVGQTDYGQQPVSEQKYDERAINKSHIIKAKRSNELDAQKSIEENEEKLTQKVTQVISQQASIDEPAREDKNEKIQALEDELAQMRMMLRKVMDQPHSDDETVTLQDALKSQAFSDQLMQDVIRKIPPASLLMPKDSEDALKSLTDYLHGAIKAGNGIGLKDGRPKIIALIGTTGVGKTTTIAKIAARFVLEKGVSVGLITADTYRISAVEQLKTYSDILGLPLEIVYSSAELKPALRKHKGKQLILIDTAGRSQNNEYQMSELKEFLEVEPSIEKHLVMSATTKERDAEKILERFSVVKPDRLIFTKVDETDTLGFIVNLLFDRRIALSYLTNGQSVPDDIEPARPDALAKLLLR